MNSFEENQSAILDLISIGDANGNEKAVGNIVCQLVDLVIIGIILKFLLKSKTGWNN